jgi:hypothetical protein
MLLFDLIYSEIYINQVTHSIILLHNLRVPTKKQLKKYLVLLNSLYRLYNLIACHKNLKEMQKFIHKLRTTRVYKNLSYTLCTKDTIIKVCQIDYLLNLKNESAISGGSVMGNSNMI